MVSHFDGVIGPLAIPRKLYSKDLGVDIQTARLKSEDKPNLALPRRRKIKWLNKRAKRKSVSTARLLDDTTQIALVRRTNCWGQRNDLLVRPSERDFSNPGCPILPCSVGQLETEQKHAYIFSGRPTPPLVLNAKAVPAADGVDRLSVKLLAYHHAKAVFAALPQSDFKPRRGETPAKPRSKPRSKEGDDHCPDSADGGEPLCRS
jgi:hypothetical protein